VINISDPTNPVRVGFYSISGAAQGVAVVSTHAYVAGGSSGVHVVDVSDPAHPSAVGFYHNRYGGANDVAVTGSYAYVAYSTAGAGGMSVVNILDPTNPIEVGAYNMSRSSAESVVVAGGYTYLADGEGGLFILRYTPDQIYLSLIHNR
jgi:hypothetical protein